MYKRQGPCTADHRLAGAKWNVPAWAWEEVTGVAQDDDCKARPNELGDLMDEVLVLPETTRFIRTILKRYDASTARGRNVVAVEPVSEAEASGDETGSATSRTQRLIDAVYTRWLASEGQASLRSANSTKILILSPDKGDASLQGVNLAPIALPNVVWSHHDYTLAVIAGSAAGQGYTEDGWASSQMQDRSEVRRPGRPTYDPDLVSFGRRLTERRGYLAQMQHWAAAGGLPIFVGEYGILTTCAPDGNLATAQAYAKASQELYDGALVEGGAAPVSRTGAQVVAVEPVAAMRDKLRRVNQSIPEIVYEAQFPTNGQEIAFLKAAKDAKMVRNYTVGPSRVEGVNTIFSYIPKDPTKLGPVELSIETPPTDNAAIQSARNTVAGPDAYAYKVRRTRSGLTLSVIVDIQRTIWELHHAEIRKQGKGFNPSPVSYTHLTLPTSDLV